MKVLLALLACVAVSHAAFTGTLQQRAQPAVAQAMFKVRLVAGRSSVRGELADAIQNQLNNVMSQIDTLMAHGQTISAGLQEHAASLMEQMQAVGGSALNAVQEHYNNIQEQLAGHVSNAVSNAQAWLSNLLNNLGFGRGKSLSALTDLVQNLNISNLQATLAAVWQEIQDQATALVNSINIHDILQGAFSSFAMQKGWFGDMWNAISGAVSEVGSAAWNHVTGTASEMWGQVVDAYETMTGHASNAFDTVQDIASSFVAEATAVGSTMTAEAAAQMGTLLGQYQDVLGDYWGTVQAAIDGVQSKPQGKVF